MWSCCEYYRAIWALVLLLTVRVTVEDNQTHGYLLERLLSQAASGIEGEFDANETDTKIGGTEAMANVADRLSQVYSHLEKVDSRLGRMEQLIQNQTEELKEEFHRIREPQPQNSVSPKEQKNGVITLHPEDISTYPFYGDNASLFQDFEAWCQKYRVAGFGPPRTHAWYYIGGGDVGAWLKDPRPSYPSQRPQIWRQTRTNQRDDIYTFQLFDDYDHFRSDRSAARHERTWYIDGVGSVLHAGAIYFHYQNHMYRLNHTSGDRRSGYLTTPDYTRGQQTYVRFHSDESGLWVTYPGLGRHLAKVVVSKLNPDTLQLSKTHVLDVNGYSYSGAFIICGRLYLVKYYFNKWVARAFFDTRSQHSLEGEPSFDISVLFNHVSQMTYNPREKLLFGWDHYHLVTWPVLWKLR